MVPEPAEYGNHFCIQLRRNPSSRVQNREYLHIVSLTLFVQTQHIHKRAQRGRVHVPEFAHVTISRDLFHRDNWQSYPAQRVTKLKEP